MLVYHTTWPEASKLHKSLTEIDSAAVYVLVLLIATSVNAKPWVPKLCITLLFCHKKLSACSTQLSSA